MKEIIHLHIGQAGIQIGNACWELFAQEHGITPEGTLTNENEKQSLKPIFTETASGSYTSKALFVDLETTVIDQTRHGKHKKLHNPSHLLSGKEDAADNFIRGHYTIGKYIIDQTLDSIRKITENCDNLEGFVIYKALGGGTGSGMGSLLQQRLTVDYAKKQQVGFNIFPSPRLSTSCVQPYNAALACHQLLNYEDMSLVLDNEALYRICSQKLDIQNPNYFTINQMISQLSSSFTFPLRSTGALSTDLTELHMNLVSFPRFRFLSASYYPFAGSHICNQNRLRVSDLTLQVFQYKNQMATFNQKIQNYMACSLLYRGDVSHREVCNSINLLKNTKTVNFVDWCPTGFKVGISQKPPITTSNEVSGSTLRSCCLISNTTAIAKLFDPICQKFDKMYAKRAFVHWYVGQGLDEGFFSQARQDLAALQMDYRQARE